VLQPNEPGDDRPELAVAPGARSAMVYLTDPGSVGPRGLQRLLKRLREIEGAEVLAWKEDGEACVWTGRGELRFAPGAAVRDPRGRSWDVEGDLRTLELESRDGEVASGTYPDALGRLWSALACEGGGDVLVSAARGYEFTDWGGADHVGGGSHGSLRHGDSLAALAFVNCGPDLTPAGERPRQWSIADVAPIVTSHFARGA
jgi:hypothetical protein